MIENVKANFCGLPIPDNEEAILLQVEQDATNPGEALGVDFLAFAIIQRNKNISLIIQQDIDQWNESIDGRMQSVQNAAEFTSGIEAGYSFMIGLISAIRYMRGNYDSIKDFLSFGVENGDIPLIGRKEVSRIRGVLSGEAIIDRGSHGEYAETSSDIAYYDAWDYVDESLVLDEMIQLEKNIIRNMLERNYKTEEKSCVDSHIDGFERGLQNAVELYLQVAEERVIEKIESMYG
jgi:hypothetical protein